MEKRERYRKAKARVDELAVLRNDIEKPLRETMQAATEHLLDEEDKAEEEYELATDDLPEFLGKCESCGTDLFEGDKANTDCERDYYACEDCAPTYSESLKEAEESNSDWYEEGADQRGKYIAFLSAQKPDEKHVWQV